MRRSVISSGLAAVFVLIWPATALAATDPGLGTAGNYGVLAATTITDAPAAGGSWVTGRMGLSPGVAAAITGFTTSTPPGPGTSGPIDAGSPGPAATAQLDLTAAYGAAVQPCTTDYSGINLGGLGTPLVPGVYCQTRVLPAPQVTSPILTGTLTLNGPGIYIFLIGTTAAPTALITAPGARISLINGAQPCDIFWRVTSSATLDTTTSFIGNIMALQSISMNNSATLWGRALASNGAVTLIHNRIIQPSGCTTGLTPNFAAPTPVAGPAGTTLPASLGTIVTAVVPGSTGIPVEMRGEFPWLLLIAMGAGLGATALGISSRRRRRRNT
jgi:hypothetical protein